MGLCLGPILGFRGVTRTAWNVSALVAADDARAPVLQWWTEDDTKRRAPGETSLLLDTGKVKIWRHDWGLKQERAPVRAFYTVAGGTPIDFTVPERGADPRIAYASCNGFSNPRDMKRVGDKNERWVDLNSRHDDRPFNILMMGGDQVYSDTIWEAVEPIKKWVERPRAARLTAAFTETMRRKVDQFYLDLYLSRWSQTEPAGAMARIPTVMMWDDHDIFDGWGSYPPELHQCPVYQGIFEVARKYFQVFQLQTPPGSPTPATLPGQSFFTFTHQFGTLAILALDMRSERTDQTIMSRGSWDVVLEWMSGLAGCSHLLIMASIPVVHPDFSLLEKVLGLLPGRQDLEDDLKDHWLSRSHKEERLRFIHRMLKFMESSSTRVTLLSGDVHVGAVGVIKSERTADGDPNKRVINQLTSSGIVHPSPPGMALHFLESAGEKVEEVDRDITARMLEVPGTRYRFIGTRNWMSLTPDDQRRLWAEWHISGQPKSFTKVVHPCG